MSICEIDLRHGVGTHGLQVRVRRGEGEKPLTKLFSFRKYGGEANARKLAEQAEIEMKAQVALESDSRRRHGHAKKPNSNSKSGIAGVLARYDANGDVIFSSFWREGPPKRRGSRVMQRSSRTHGLFGALRQVLDARAANTGIKQPSPRAAWEIIKLSLGGE